MIQHPGVILAGGQARRMGGGDKGLLRLGGQTLLARVIARLAPQVSAIALNANGDPGRFASYELPVLPDPVPGFVGPLGGVLAALEWAASQGAERVATVAADTPFFPDDLVACLARAGDGIVLAATLDAQQRRNRHPTFGLWPVALREDLRRSLHEGTRKVVAWTDAHGGRDMVFDSAPSDPFFNINRPEDLALAEARLARAAT